MTLTAASVRHGALEPSLDAQAHNAHQGRLLLNPTPEADSIIEHFELASMYLRRGDLEGSSAHIRAGMSLLGALARSNGMELREVRRIAGWSDDAVTTLNDAERNGGGAESGRKLAYRLKPVLDALDGETADDARADLICTFRQTPASVLFARAVTHQLQPRRTALLRGEYARWAERVGRVGVAA